MSKLSGKLEGDYVAHFWSWIKRPIPQNSVWKCLYVDGIIEEGPMMCMSSVTHGNIKDEKWLTREHKALKWAKTNNTFPKGSPSWVPMANWMTMTLASRLWWL